MKHLRGPDFQSHFRLCSLFLINPWLTRRPDGSNKFITGGIFYRPEGVGSYPFACPSDSAPVRRKAIDAASSLQSNWNVACKKIKMYLQMSARRNYIGYERSMNGRRSLPVLLHVQRPLPLQMVRLVVIGEEALHGVAASREHAGRRLVYRCRVRLGLHLRSVAAHHVLRIVHWNATPQVLRGI